MKISLYFGYIAPYILLILFNSIIIYTATRYERKHKNSISSSIENRSAKRKTQMTRMIILITFLYIMTSLPNTIVTGYLYNTVVRLDVGQLIINLINGIHFSYPAFNFFILFFSNKLFAEEVKFMFCRGNRNRVFSVSRSNTKGSTLNNGSNLK